MKPELRFEEKMMTVSDLGEDAGVPSLVGSLILQNDLDFHLGEEEEIYEGYGKRTNSYPYKQYQSYNRNLNRKNIRTAVLENDFIKAVFLPGLGGRLWELVDKTTGRNLLYTNDVIRYSNLAVCNAWFSGGVEWNIGVIGHSPFTTEPLFTARLEDEAGNPVLRMYEYERIRGVEYQMDFWLGETDTYLNCRMRIVNSGSEVVPMYWWSNMAVPEYEGGRIVVPAKQAYTSRGRDIYKVDIPVVEDADITRYETIPGQVDYFFDIPEKSPKFIANLDGEGYGLLHISTNRLKSRKLFSWGNNPGSARWQEFLTKEAGRYVEIQAGLGKTQYGCIPMASHTAWEWMEQYGAVSVERELKDGGFENLKNHMEKLAESEGEKRQIEEKLKQSKRMALSAGELIYGGSGYGALQKQIREFQGGRELSPQLDYGTCKGDLPDWMTFLKTGKFMKADPDSRPGSFMCEPCFYEKLRETIKTCNRDNWYAHYHLGIMEVNAGKYNRGEQELKRSFKLTENPWACHGLASLYILTGRKEKAAEYMEKGLKMRPEDSGYVKDGFKLLLAAGAYGRIPKLWKILPEPLQADSRLRFDYMSALSETGKVLKAYDLLTEDFVLDDLREGEDSVSDLWKKLYTAKFPKAPAPEAVPQKWNFDSTN